MSKKFVRKVIPLALAFILTMNLITVHGEEVKPNVKASLTLSKTIDKSEVLKNGTFTLSYQVTPQKISVDKIPRTGSQKAKEIVFIIDKSGSMEWNVNGGTTINANNPSRMSIVKAAATSFIDSIKAVDNIKVALVEYDTLAYPYKQSSNNYWFSLSNNGHYNTLRNNINNIDPEGGTNIGDAIRIGKEVLDSGDANAEKYFVFMTDGVPTAYSRVLNWLWYEYYTGRGTAPGYFVNSGSDDYNNYSFEYAKLMASKLSTASNNYFIAFADNDAGNKLESISAQSVKSTYQSATSSDALSIIYDEIADEVITEFNISNAYFQETFPEDFEVIGTSSNLTKNGQIVSGYIGTKAGNINYKLNEAGTFYEASPVEFTITLKAKKAGDYWVGASSNNYIQYVDVDGTVGRKQFNAVAVTVQDYNPLQDGDPNPNQVKIDSDIVYTGIDVDWDESDTSVKYYLLGDQNDTGDNSKDKYFTINPDTGKVSVRDMKKLRSDIATHGTSILQKYISVNTGNSYEYLSGNQEVTLTTEGQNQVGFFQTKAPINLTKKTEINFELNLGSRNDYGADGVVFALNDKAFNVDADSVSSGGGLGYDKQDNKGMENLFVNSIGFEFDTWINPLEQFNSVSSVLQLDNYSKNNRYNDDHIAFIQNGTIAHLKDNVIYKSEGNLTSKTAYGLDKASKEFTGYTGSQFTPGNLEDGKWRKGQVIWDPETNRLSLNYDLNADGTITANEKDLVVSTQDLELKFPQKTAYFGITAATGTYYNNQKIRNINVKENDILNMNGNIVVKAVQGTDTYYTSFDFDIISDGKAISEVNRTVNTTVNLSQEFDSVYTFSGDPIMLTNVGSEVPFTNIYFTEQFPPYMDIVSYPAGLVKTGTLETGYKLQGAIPGITLKQNNATRLYEVNGNFTIKLKATRVNTLVLDKGTINYTDPNNIANSVVVPASSIYINENIKPIITIDARHDNGNPASPKFVITGMLDGTSTEIVEARYLKTTGTATSMTLEEFKNKISTSTVLATNKNPNYVNLITQFAPYKNKADFTFTQFTLTENGYYYLYVKDAAGNEEIKLIYIKNIKDFIPILT
jgi:hypothetical protein